MHSSCNHCLLVVTCITPLHFAHHVDMQAANMLQRQLRLCWQAEPLLQQLIHSHGAQQQLGTAMTAVQLPILASCSGSAVPLPHSYSQAWAVASIRTLCSSRICTITVQQLELSLASGRGSSIPSSSCATALQEHKGVLHHTAQLPDLSNWRPPASRTQLSANRHFSTGADRSGSSPPAQSGGAADAAPSAGSQQLHMSLQEALVKLVDAAVEQVEQGRTEEAVAILKEGIATFEPNFPDSPELGELHNQVALLSLVAGDVDGAVTHATAALDITRKHFAGSGALMGHRQLRLGVSYFAQGRLTDAVGLLHSAEEALTTAGDASSAEARYHTTLSILAGTRDVGQVTQFEGKLLTELRSMKKTFGPDSMIVSLALSQHDRIVHQPLSAAEPNPMLCEALLKQHAKLLESVNPTGEDLAVAQYKLATFYYVHDMLPDAQSYIRQAGAGLRALLPEEHDLVALCKHRLGMICAVSGDHRAATQLLAQSLERFGGTGSSSAGSGAMSGLAREAEFGLAVAKYKAHGPVTDGPARAEALKVVRERLDGMAAAIGLNHMLVRGAMRHFAQMKAMAGL